MPRKNPRDWMVPIIDHWTTDANFRNGMRDAAQRQNALQAAGINLTNDERNIVDQAGWTEVPAPSDLEILDRAWKFWIFGTGPGTW